MTTGTGGKVIQLVRQPPGRHPARMYYWELTLAWPAGKTWRTRTWSGTVEVRGHPRSEVCGELFSKCLAETGQPDAAVMFRSLEPEILA